MIASAVSAVLLFIIQKRNKLDTYPAAARAFQATARFAVTSTETSAPVLLSVCVLIGFTCLGAIRLSSFYKLRPNDIRSFVGNERKLATIRGLIITDPYIDRNENWKFARFKFTDPETSFYLKLDEIKTVDGWADVTGTVRVQVDEPILDLKAGDYIQAYCWLDRFKSSTNPGEFDIAKYLARKNVFIAASIQTRDAIELLQSSSTRFFAKIKRKAREIAVQSLLGSTYPQDENERLLLALVLGYRAAMDSVTYEAFRKTGLLHFVCLSGMNFMILFWIIWQLCKTAGLMKPARAVICFAAAGIFLLVIPWQPPAFRAAIMSSVFCISFFFRRKSDPFNSLSLAAIILLLIRPTELFEADWQLSFATVLGILLFAKPVEDFLYEKVAAFFEDPLTGKLRSYFDIVSKLASPVIAVFAVSFVAWLTSAGILLYNFYTVQPLTSIWTVVASPFIAVISFLGYLKLLVGLVLPTTASVLDVIIKPLSSWLIWLVKHIAQIDVSQVLVGRVSPVIVIFYYVFLFVAFFAHFHRPLTKKIICAAAALAIIVFLGVTKLQRTHRDNLVLTCLDVGHGQAILARLPGGANILFDAGSLHKSDIGRQIVAPFLDYSGLSKIDAVIISHNDVDHINGIPEIVEHCDIGAIFANDAFFSKTDSWGTAKFLEEQLLKKGHKIQRVDKNLDLASAANIKILWPTKQICRNEELDDNDKSLVILIEFAGRKMLLCSDIMNFAQRELLQLYPDLKADVVVVPHHGSIKTADPNFLGNLDADILLCSCEERQYERVNFSADDKLIVNNAKSFYTPRNGAIIIRIDKDGTIVNSK